MDVSRFIKIFSLVGLCVVFVMAMSRYYAVSIVHTVVEPAGADVQHIGTNTNGHNEATSAELARQIKQEDPGSFLGTGSVPRFFHKMTIGEAQKLFHSKMLDNPFKCSEIKRFGKAGDGGYDVCVQEPFRPKSGACLVYSFGMNKDDHIHKPNMYFHNLGVWGSNMKNDLGWELRDLATIIKMLNHTKRTIDYLKIDVEGAEWSLLEHIVHSGVHSQIKQMVLEIHTPRLIGKSESMSLLDYGEIYNGFTELDDIGFTKFQYHANNGCCGKFSILTPKNIAKRNLCCYETFYVNKKYL